MAAAAVAAIDAAPLQHPWPLFDLFLDLPHPAASKSSPPPVLIQSPEETENVQATLPSIARFAFPEYEESSSSSPPTDLPLNRYDRYAMQLPGFQHFTFTLQLASGTRLHGHVRRFLPLHASAPSRYDVGRRGERALVILTRTSGAATLYAAILKSLEAIASQHASLPDLAPRPDAQRWFLLSLLKYQQHLAQVYVNKPLAERGRPLVAALSGLEFNTALYQKVDTTLFVLPTCLLHRPMTTDHVITQGSSSMLPLLRCVGVAHALRILAALLSERRVILISSSPTRLATCSHAALSMLGQGLLHWQHLFLPVLPPHLWPYLAAPYPYLIGILTSTAERLDRTDGLGEVLIIQLDSNSMETRGMEPGTIAERLPDLLSMPPQQRLESGPQAVLSASEYLAQDLMEILKDDKRMLYGEATFNVGETAAKATKAVKNTFFKLRDKGRQYLQQRSGSLHETPPSSSSELPVENVEEGEVKSLAADYIYTEGCHNEVCEEEARVAFATFFLSMYGNMRWYLSASPGQVPQLDRHRFLQQKRAMGDGEGTPMWPLLNNFCQTQMLEEFAKARIEEVRLRQPVAPDAPLFAHCAEYHRVNKVDFGVLSVRRICQQVALSIPSRGTMQSNARRTAMTLTSNKAYEGDFGGAIAQLVEQCRECSSALFDVMSVIWLRLRDSKGGSWKHGFNALQLLRNLLYHGPLAAVTEATDGLDKIRALKFYENGMRAQAAQQMRGAASQVYSLLVDRAQLFAVRRFCAERRRELRDPRPRPPRDARLSLRAPFRLLHAITNPNASSGTLVSLPPTAPAGSHMERGAAEATVDFLGTAPAPATVVTSGDETADIFGLSSPLAQQSAASSQSVVDLFGSMSVSAPAQSANGRSPFDDPAPQPSPAPQTPGPMQVTPAPLGGDTPRFAYASQQPMSGRVSPYPGAQGTTPPGRGASPHVGQPTPPQQGSMPPQRQRFGSGSSPQTYGSQTLQGQAPSQPTPPRQGAPTPPPGAQPSQGQPPTFGQQRSQGQPPAFSQQPSQGQPPAFAQQFPPPQQFAQPPARQPQQQFGPTMVQLPPQQTPYQQQQQPFSGQPLPPQQQPPYGQAPPPYGQQPSAPSGGNAPNQQAPPSYGQPPQQQQPPRNVVRQFDPFA